MTADIAIITAVYDAYDVLKPALPQVGLSVEWVCVTDDPALRPEGWQTVVLPAPGMHPNRAAKIPKLSPWRFTNAPASIWIDASFRITSPAFAREALALADPIAQFVHPWRDCVYAEADASAPLPKYTSEPLAEQVRAYRWDGHPERWGLWATGVIARRHTPDVRRLSRRWSDEIAAWSFQDQLSQPVALRSTGLRPAPFPGTHISNDWVRYEGSGRH